MTTAPRTSPPRVLLTNPIHPELQPVLAQHCDLVVAPDTRAETLVRLIAGAEGLMVRAQLPPALFDHAPKLRAVVRHGVGLDMIPVDAATARGIPVANLPGSNTQAVVEYCLAAMLQLRRGLATMDSRLRSDGWTSARPLADRGIELGGSTCGIVGVGAWFAGLFVVFPALAAVRQLLEHRDALAHDDADYRTVDHGPVTRVFRTGPVTRWFGGAGFDRHLLHHLQPTLSYTRLGAFEGYLLDTEARDTVAGATTTYWRTLRQLWRGRR